MVDYLEYGFIPDGFFETAQALSGQVVGFFHHRVSGPGPSMVDKVPGIKTKKQNPLAR